MHAEALLPRAAALFPRLARFKNFYLVGGTALALHIGHRISVDFDLFSAQALPPTLLRRVKRIFARASVTVTYRAPEQLNLLIDNVKCTFFRFEYPIVEAVSHYHRVPLVSLRELAAMKAFAIGKRLAYKDYVDWYFMLKEKHVQLAEVIRVAKKKFKHDFSDRLFLGQLVSLADVPTQKIDFLRGEVERGTIQKFLEKTVRQYKI
ncbi:MAG: nucleotidyl transferase AbiEii/AbiGii toxin family protein [Candidatus Magasanikbacteria bacterium]|nr:nucleotidyl transferase AbiEii/AbiGii toxin family protein [Candidatus Magasanikbacteria bacterium]